MRLIFSKKGGVFMLKEMSRRDFLKASAVTGASILASDLLYTDPIVYGAINIPEAEKITITSIIDNYSETTRPSYKIANRYGDYLYAQHGLSCHIETVVDGHSHSLLFDFGPTFPGLSGNMDALKIDLDKLEALALSHGHRDHFGGLVELLKSRREKIPKGIPLYVGEEAFAERGQGQRVAHRPPKKEDIEGLGFVKIVEIKDPTPIVSGAYLTGRIEKVTDYEKVDPGRWVKKEDNLEPETFIGEQSVVLNLKGKGLVVVTGCAHVGVVNTGSI
jgi:7,8-dihydropterin-6-yl-methyl-4-(beta-D-ribofuranosyl)aminobenzene 5'-phosphate synthase